MKYEGSKLQSIVFTLESFYFVEVVACDLSLVLFLAQGTSPNILFTALSSKYKRGEGGSGWGVWVDLVMGEL